MSSVRAEEPMDILFFFFNDTATTEIYTLSLHDALPICRGRLDLPANGIVDQQQLEDAEPPAVTGLAAGGTASGRHDPLRDRKSTRLNSSHANISYAVFCLKKKTQKPTRP